MRIAGVLFQQILVSKTNVSVGEGTASVPGKPFGSEKKWPMIQTTGQTREIAKEAGRDKIPITGASIVKSVLIIVNGIGCFKNTGTTKGVTCDCLQKWTRQSEFFWLNRALTTSSLSRVKFLQRWTRYLKKST